MGSLREKKKIPHTDGGAFVAALRSTGKSETREELLRGSGCGPLFYALVYGLFLIIKLISIEDYNFE